MASIDRLIIFTRYPETGKAKTRLIPALGAEGAAALHRRMADHTLVQVQALQFQHPLCVEVRFAGGDRDLMQRWLGTDLMYTVQGEGDLGDRMGRSFQSAFDASVDRAVIIGTDCPDLNATLLDQAFRELQHHDLVLGPASDGGYYLIGMRRLIPQLFIGMEWSTATVLERTLEIAAELNLSVALLPVLSDVDYPADLDIWERYR
ncbi:MAG: TIGR04282 family arsenosugar biosynthesis glycosyltransferase [Leptolyngbyaceae cyanobacterium CAN_BIN12]|nr:TIGR04282 family arsenosugar biosynthesis glycosyltransferase [Leptolyngbyaceae cyanobacterium CAN_BIN12]